MSSYNIVAVLINHRRTKAAEVQEVFTKYGCNIKVRLGLHEAGDTCSEEGLVVLQICGTPEELNAFKSQLNDIEGVKAESLTINS